MSADGEFRRMVPAPGRSRRPGLLAVLVRWRIELLLLGIVAQLWHLAGGVVVGLVGVAVAASVAFVPTVRHVLASAVRTVAVTHRARAGIVQAGVTDRSGRPPWLPWARPIGPNGVMVGVWLRAGTTAGDLREATQVIAAACGATAVVVEQDGVRNDRVQLHVVRPRWGLPGR